MLGSGKWASAMMRSVILTAQNVTSEARQDQTVFYVFYTMWSYHLEPIGNFVFVQQDQDDHGYQSSDESPDMGDGMP